MTSPNGASAPDLESILRRVRKLLAIAEDSRGDPNECAAAASQAERIMRKYQIENADLLLAGMQNTADFHAAVMGSGSNPFDLDGRYSVSCGRIAVAVAQLYDCIARLDEIYADGKLRQRLQLQGLRLDVQLARYSYLMLVNSMDASATLWKQRQRATARERGEYIAGYATEVCKLLKAAKAEKDADAARAHSFGALVIAKSALVAAHFGPANYSQGRSAADTAASRAGAADGRYADIGRKGVEGCASTTRRIGA